MGDPEAGVTTTRRRLGLALSGGGLRASLFHIGVLARLAELNLLREVEVISTVSGGSIIGALYYLHIRRLLERHHDAAITPRHYVDLVAEIAAEFPLAIGSNLRMRAFADLGKNWRMFYDPRYSRSDRMAELYEQYLYAPHATAGENGRIELPALLIQPRGAAQDFHPFEEVDGRTGNDDRVNKVPALVINATTLNTGHLFQFTASGMGEPTRPGEGTSADGNLHLRSGRYCELPKKYRTLPLGVAVAASAAVPGIFPPMALTDLFVDGGAPFTPQLVDGGVNDNQGISALFDQKHYCTHVIISDASGQMNDIHNPSPLPGAVMQRSNSILMDRVREEQFNVARLRTQESPGRVALLHLKQGLRQRDLPWIGGAQGADAGASSYSDHRTRHRVHPRVQEQLASVRTDLDAFTQTECHALMADGYLIAEDQMGAMAAEWGRTAPCGPETNWPFLSILPLLANPDAEPRFSEQLALAKRRVGKTVRLVPWMRWIAHPWTVRLVAILLLTGFAFLASRVGATALATALGAVVAAFLGLGLVAGLHAWSDASRRAGLERGLRWTLAFVPGLFIAPALALLADRHLAVFNTLRCEEGEVGRVNGSWAPPESSTR